MTTREKTNKQKVLDYVQEQFENAKEMRMFQMLRKEVEIGANGTQKYVIKKGPNKGKIV
jgi:hypothetical protein